MDAYVFYVITLENDDFQVHPSTNCSQQCMHYQIFFPLSYSETANFVDYEKYKMITIGSKNVKKDDERKAI